MSELARRAKVFPKNVMTSGAAGFPHPHADKFFTDVGARSSLFWLLVISFLLLTVRYALPQTETIDIGSGRDTPLIQGFSFREDVNGGSGNFRWSGARAEIRFWGLGYQDGSLVLRIAAPRPQGSARVQVRANDQLLGEIDPTGGFQDYQFKFDRDVIGAGGDLIVTLSSDTFTLPPDTRDLGLELDSATIRTTGGLFIPPPRSWYLIACALLGFVVLYLWLGSSARALGALMPLSTLALLYLWLAPTETVWYAAPLFWFGFVLLLLALMFARLLQHWTPQLSTRTVRLLFGVMAIAFVVRLVLASGPGYIVDVQDYVVWSYKTVTYGLGTAYSAVNGLWISDQSPGIVYVLHAMGLVYRAVFSPDFLYPGVAGDPSLRALITNPALLADPVQRTLLRLPSLFADVMTGALILSAALRLQVSPQRAWLAALAFWFNPAVLWNGAYWGQMDALHSLLVLIAFLFMGANRVGLSFLTLGIAAATKPQAAVFAPLLLLWAWKSVSIPAIRKNANAELVARLGRAGSAIAAGALGAGLVIAPVLLAGGGDGLLAYLSDTVGHHPILSANAHNLWWFLKNGSIDVPDTKEIISGIPLTFRTASLALFGLVYVATLLKARYSSREEYFSLGAFIGFAFFMLPTEIHENYGYALLPLLAVAMAIDKKWIPFFVAVSVTMTLNYALSDPPLLARFGIDDPVTLLAVPRWLNSLANTVLFVVWGVYLFTRREAALSGQANLVAPQGALQ